MAGRTFRSRLIGGRPRKYKDYALNAARGRGGRRFEIVTVALRRVNLLGSLPADALVDYVEARSLHLPAQYGGLLHRRGRRAHPAPGARSRRLQDLVKLEVLSNTAHLYPDMEEILCGR